MIINRKINFAVVGCGRISQKHLAAIAQTPEAELVAVCDTDLKKLRQAAEICKIKAYSSFADLLQDPLVEIVSICTPSGLHASMAIQAMRAGKDVLVEKPMAMSVADAKQMILTAKQTGRLLVEVKQNRFNPPVVYLKNNLSTLGKVHYFEGAAFWYRPQEYYDDGVHGTRGMDGGALMNQGVHYVDMMLYLLSKKPTEIFAIGETLAHKMECEDVAVITMRFSDKSIASLRINTLAYPKNFEGSITLFAEKATVKIGGVAMDKLIHWEGSEKTTGSPNETDIVDIYGAGHRKVIENVCLHKLMGSPLYISNNETLATIEIMEAACHSMRERKNVIL